MGNGKYEELKTVSCDICKQNDYSQLVKIVSKPEERLVFATYLQYIGKLKESFTHSMLINIPRTKNKKADMLVRSARNQPSFV